MRELITAQTIADARRAGQQSVSVAPNALITPQAKDDAKLYGMTIVFREEVSAPVAHPVPTAPTFGQGMTHQHAYAPHMAAPAQPVYAQPVYGQSVQGYRPLYAPEPLSYSSPMQQNRTLMNTNNPNNGVAPAWAAPVIQFGNTASQGFAQPQAAPSPAAPNAAEIAAQVAAQLQQLLGNNAALQNTVSQVVSEVMGGVSPQTTGTPCGSAAPVAGTIAGVDVIPFSSACPSTSVQGEVSIEEAFVPGADGPGVTRFSWANTALEWTFAHDEVLVVTKGTVLISQGGVAVNVAAGGAVRIRKGTSVTLTAQGEACCLSSSWPA